MTYFHLTGKARTLHPGMRRLIHSAATWPKIFRMNIEIIYNKFHFEVEVCTWALNLPTSDCLNRNCLLRFDKSIVSMSITSMFLKPIMARFLRSSQPSPPAPMTSTLMFSRRNGKISADGVNVGGVRGPRLSSTWITGCWGWHWYSNFSNLHLSSESLDANLWNMTPASRPVNWGGVDLHLTLKRYNCVQNMTHNVSQNTFSSSPTIYVDVLKSFNNRCPFVTWSVFVTNL